MSESSSGLARKSRMLELSSRNASAHRSASSVGMSSSWANHLALLINLLVAEPPEPISSELPVIEASLVVPNQAGCDKHAGRRVFGTNRSTRVATSARRTHRAVHQGRRRSLQPDREQPFVRKSTEPLDTGRRSPAYVRCALPRTLRRVLVANSRRVTRKGTHRAPLWRNGETAHSGGCLPLPGSPTSTCGRSPRRAAKGRVHAATTLLLPSLIGQSLKKHRCWRWLPAAALEIGQLNLPIVIGRCGP